MRVEWEEEEEEETRFEEEAGAGRGCLTQAGVRVREIEGEIARALRCTVAVLYRYSDRLGFRSVCVITGVVCIT